MNTIACSPLRALVLHAAVWIRLLQKVTNATLSGYSGTGTPNCDGTKDTAAIDCLTSRINSDGCSSAVCDGWKRTITGQKSFSKPFVAGGLANYTSFEPQSTFAVLEATHI